MLLDFCNAVYNKALTLTKSSKNDAGVFFSLALDTQMKHGSVKAKCFVDDFVKMISDAKSFIWNFFWKFG